jgi:hypothetical protein
MEGSMKKLGSQKWHRMIILAGIVMLNFVFMANSLIAEETDYFTVLTNLGTNQGDRAKADGLNKSALVSYGRKDYSKALEFWYQAALSDPSWRKPFYNLACLSAIGGETDKAFVYLDMALMRDAAPLIQPLQKDSDLASLRTLPRYAELLFKYDTNGINDNEFQSIADQLTKLSQTEYFSRNHFAFTFQKIDGSLAFNFGGPAEVGGTIYKVADFRKIQGQIAVKLIYGGEESFINLKFIGSKTVRIIFGKNFDWGIGKELDFFAR